MKNKHWLVTLNIFLGGYEKMTHNVVSAPDEYAAWELALRNECHNEPIFDSGKGACNDGDEFMYQVYEATELSDEEYKTLKKLRIA